jgi:hypothetical protein
MLLLLLLLLVTHIYTFCLLMAFFFLIIAHWGIAGPRLDGRQSRNSSATRCSAERLARNVSDKT